LSLALIIEEGFNFGMLEYITNSISINAKKAGVFFVTGDLKVVERGALDKIFINTSGIGRIVNSQKLSVRNIRPGDKIIITGNIGQHGLAVLAKRKELDLGFNIKSDCAPLSSLILPVLKKIKAIRFMRDPTRGGLATTLTEIAEQTGLGIVINEANLPVSKRVRAASELLGLDPLYIANEGNAVLVVKKDSQRQILSFLKKHPLGRYAQVIGEVLKARKPQVVLNTIIGAERIIDMLSSDPLPRIC
jgi:hydrogenase expression/formation protein HypE